MTAMEAVLIFAAVFCGLMFAGLLILTAYSVGAEIDKRWKAQ